MSSCEHSVFHSLNWNNVMLSLLLRKSTYLQYAKWSALSTLGTQGTESSTRGGGNEYSYLVLWMHTPAAVGLSSKGQISQEHAPDGSRIEENYTPASTSERADNAVCNVTDLHTAGFITSKHQNRPQGKTKRASTVQMNPTKCCIKNYVYFYA